MKWEKRFIVYGIGIVIISVIPIVITRNLSQSVHNNLYEIDKKEMNESIKDELVIYTSHPNDFVIPLIDEYESITGIKVEVIYGGSGELIERIDGEQGEPYSDILWGGSLSTLKPQMALFEPYQSGNEEYIQEEFRNSEGMLTRFTDVPSVLMVNTDLIGDIVITGYEDLLNPKLKGKIAYSSPNISSSAYEHLINILYAVGDGDPGFAWDYISEFCENLDGNLLSSSKSVYNGVLHGEYVVGLIFEEAAAAMVAKGNPIQIIYMKEGVLSTPDCVSIVRNARNMENAKTFIDFVTGYDAQNLIASKLNRRSVRTDIDLPKYLLEKSEMKLIFVDRNEVNRKKSEWIQNFRNIFYHIQRQDGAMS